MTKETSAGGIIPDRRRESRLRFEAKATVTFSGAVFSASTRDLTSSGAFLVTELRLPESTRVELSIDLGDGHPEVDVCGCVVRSDHESDDAPGFAVEFDGIEPDDSIRILEATQRS